MNRALVAAAMLFPFSCMAIPADAPLEPDQAFEISVRPTGPTQLEVRWRIAEGCYLYRDRIRFFAEGARLGVPRFPRPEMHTDPFLGTAAIYRGEAAVSVPISASNEARSIELRVDFQGCDGSRGICYPLASRRITVDLSPSATEETRIPK